MRISFLSLVFLFTSFIGFAQSGDVLINIGSQDASVSKKIGVSVPTTEDNFEAPGQLVIRGEAGRGQTDSVSYVSCGKDPKMFSCSSWLNKTVLLNQVIQVAAGFYLVSYDDTKHPGFVEVLPGETTEIHLRKIIFNSSTGYPFRFEAHLDLETDGADNRELAKIAFFAWHGSYYSIRDYYQPCKKISSSDDTSVQDYCNAWASPESLLLGNTPVIAIASAEDRMPGQLILGKISKENESDLLKVKYFYSGDTEFAKYTRANTAFNFVSVFPGLYRTIVRTNDHKIETRGILVE